MAQFSLFYVSLHLSFVLFLWLMLELCLQYNKKYAQNQISLRSEVLFGFMVLFSWDAYFKVYLPALLPETKAMVDNLGVSVLLDIVLSILQGVIIPVIVYEAYKYRHLVWQLRRRIAAFS